mgnify:CR=1 FL=1|jgi:hypothetical protein
MTLKSRIKRQRLWNDCVIVLSLLVLTACVGQIIMERMFVSYNELFGKRTIQEISCRVSAGDTLWTIAGQITQPDEDVRDKVIAIRKLNGLAANQTIQPGQVIKIPVKQLQDSGWRYTWNDRQ